MTKTLKLHRIRTIFSSLMILAVLFSAFGMPQPARAAASLTIEPITWNVIGLDSNNVLDGPNDFPIGARVCNTGTGTVTNVSSKFFWDDPFYSGVFTSSPLAHPYINLRDGSLREYKTANSGAIPSLLEGECTDFYYEVVINRTSTAYDKTRNYHITAWSSEVTTPVSTLTPREIFIEHLISQSRNSVTQVDLADDVSGSHGTYVTIYNGTPTSQTISLQEGYEYWFKVYADTATNGYEQIETFLNLPNVIFQVEKVETTYTVESSAHMTPLGPNGDGDYYYDQLYGDACLWENDPASANYMDCLSTGKAGGDVTVSYKVKVLSIPTTDVIELNTLIYDFSGSSFHYNNDFSDSTLLIKFVDYDSLFSKDFKPGSILPGSTSTLTFSIVNPASTTLTNVHFTDTLPTTPGQMSVANPANASTLGCGSPTFTPTAGAASLSFTGGTIIPYGSCTIKVDVTVSKVPLGPSYLDIYHNDSGPLYFEKNADPNYNSGLIASDDLYVTLPLEKPDFCTNLEATQMAQWSFENGGAPSEPSSLNPTTKPFVSPNPLLTSGSLAGTTGTSGLSTAYSVSSSNSWLGTGGWPYTTDPIPTVTTTANYPHYDFKVDTRFYSFARITFPIMLRDSANWAGSNPVYVFTSTDGGATFTAADPASDTSGVESWTPSLETFIAQTGLTDNTGAMSTLFRIIPYGVNPAQQDTAEVYLDDVTISGCGANAFPTLAKSFSPNPIAVQDGINTPDYSTLTFTIHNPNTTTALDGVNFLDEFPSGLVVKDPSGVTTPNCTDGAISGGYTITAEPGTSSVSLSGATLSGLATCTFSVDVIATSNGYFENTSGYISHVYDGVIILPPSDYPGAYANDSLTAYIPALVVKNFSPAHIFSGGTSTLTFTIYNQNSINSLTGINFTDTYPDRVLNTDPLNFTNNTCGVSPTGAAGGSSIALSGLDLAAGTSCSFSVDVTATTTDPSEAFPNSTTVSSTGTSGTIGATGPITLTGNTTDDTLYAESATPALTLLKHISVEYDTDNHLYSNWLKEVTAPVGANIKYQFTVENTGNVDLTSIHIIDDKFPTQADACVFPGTLYGTLSTSEPSFATCETDPITVVTPGPVTNTATAYGTYTSTDDVDSDPSAAVYIDGTTATPVTLSYFLAKRQGRNVNFEWSTSTETTNAGFNLYVDHKGKKTRINPELIFSQAISSLDQHDYSFSVQVDGNSFFIEDVSLDGEVKLHGPYQLGKKYGEKVDPDLVTWTDIQAEHKTKDDKRQNEIKRNLNIPASALKPANPSSNSKGSEGNTDQAQPSITETPTATAEPITKKGNNGKKETPTPEPTIAPTEVPAEVLTEVPTEVPTVEPTATPEPTQLPPTYAYPMSVDPNSLMLENTFNFKVNQTGIQHVTFETINDAGLDLAGVPTNSITVINQELMVPVYVFTPVADGTFAPGGYIEFYGQALDTLYTDTNIYTLQLSSEFTSQVANFDAAPAPNSTTPGSYLETLKVNNQLAYADYAPGTDPWYDTQMLVYTTSKSWSFPFTLNGLADPSMPASLKLTIWGLTNWQQNPDHHIVASINGVQLADQIFDGLQEKIIQVELPAGTLVEGTNTLQMTLPGDSGVGYEISSLDKYKLEYQRIFQARDDHLTFNSSGEAFNITNLSNAQISVYRIHNDGMVRLDNVSILADGSNFTVSFAGTDHADTYLVTADGGTISPTLQAVKPVTGLNNPAQYLVISHPDFIDGLSPLVAARQAQGLTVNIVDVNDLYERYSNGILDPAAIKQYIAYASQNLGTQYVLLVGGDTYDYRNYTDMNSISFIPSIYTRTGDYANFVPVDPLYADLNGDNSPDLAIGRFPVRTSNDLNLMVAKTLAYADKTYGQTAVFASDLNDGIVSFKASSNTMVNSLPIGWNVQSIDLDDLSVAAARTQLLNSMNNGTALVTFTGHSGPTKWTFNDLFNTSDAAALTNYGKPFVAVQWGCWNTYYVDPAHVYLIQSLLFSGNNGAAAVLGATTLTDSRSEQLLGMLLTPAMVTPGMTIGQALQNAKSQLAATHPELLDVLLGWSLMGDPALIIQP